MRPLRSQRSFDVAARLDHLAFDSGWGLDVDGIEEACRATPVHRIRLAVTATDEPAGYMVTGRNGSAGFIQRLAVDPAYEGQGVATSLLQDGLGWLAKRRVTDILVNTHLDNQRALSLYQRIGFEQLPLVSGKIDHRTIIARPHYQILVGRWAQREQALNQPVFTDFCDAFHDAT
jgi:ribosomal protein S18 acetylase RimI-like enzyme